LRNLPGALFVSTGMRPGALRTQAQQDQEFSGVLIFGARSLRNPTDGLRRSEGVYDLLDQSRSLLNGQLLAGFGTLTAGQEKPMAGGADQNSQQAALWAQAWSVVRY